VTITRAELVITLTEVKKDSLWRGRVTVQPIAHRSFPQLGVEGPSLPLRLKSFGEISWSVPSRADTILRELQDEYGSLDLHLEFQFTVTASGQALTSEPLGIGTQVGSPLGKLLYEKHHLSTGHLDIEGDFFPWHRERPFGRWIHLMLNGDADAE
jgi:hypothetical protein